MQRIPQRFTQSGIGRLIKETRKHIGPLGLACLKTSYQGLIASTLSESSCAPGASTVTSSGVA